MENKLRIVIADDERPARMFLRQMLETFDDTEIVGEAENGAQAVEIIEQTKPDLALLDLQMPVVTGLEAVKLIRKKMMPLIAFVTAYDEYAVQAFEVNAVDYLLKPVDRSRLRETLNRAQERLEQTDFREREAATEIYEETIKQPMLERIPVKYRDAFHYKGLSVRPEGVFAFRKSINDVYSLETPTAGYGLFNVNASYTYGTEHYAHIFTVSALNLNDKLYRNHLSFIKDLAPEQGRGVRLSYTFRFF